MSYLNKYFHTVSAEKRDSAAIAFLASIDHLQKNNPLVAGTIIRELKDQRSYLKLIASENFSSLATQLAMGNLLTDKYAEGFARHRFYAGCDNVDKLEEEAALQAKHLFGADHAYVQPHSGVDANLVALRPPRCRHLEARQRIDELFSERVVATEHPGQFQSWG